MPKDNSFKNAVVAAGSNKRFPALTLVRPDPALAATLSKLVPGQEAPLYGRDGNRETIVPNAHAFREQMDTTAQNIADAETAVQMLPDLELVFQIQVSSILSPKDMMTTELTYMVNEGLMAPEVSSALIQEAQLYFEQDYKIKPLLSKMLRDMLFQTGSYAAAVIPENALDDAINGHRNLSVESVADSVNPDGSMRPLGLLGAARRDTPRQERARAGMAMEAFDAPAPAGFVDGRVTLEGVINQRGVGSETFLSVTDNPDVLKLPEVHHRLREKRILQSLTSRSKYRSFNRALEAHHSGKDSQVLTDRDLAALLYKDKQFSYKPITSLKTQEQLNRRTVGNPLVMHLPSESVMPVHVPGNPAAHVGFFVMLDADGHPIRKDPNSNYYQELGARLTSTGSFPSAMMAKVRGMWSGFDPNRNDLFNFSARAYGSMVEQELLARLRNGLYGNGVAISNKEEVWRIMLARALQQQHTQLLFLPAELMTYFAFKYSDSGVGKSLMEDMKIINSLRSMLVFSNVMASLKNSVGRTQVKLKLDESDPNPQKTIELAIHEIIKSRAQYFPLGINRPTDLVDYLQRAGYEFVFEGHPGLPDVNVDFGEKNTSYVKPDDQLEDLLRKRSIMGLGLSPENVDAGFTAEFATSVLHNNLLLSKRVMQYQEQFTPQLSDHLRKVMLNSELLMKKLREILENNFEKLQANVTDKGKEMLKGTEGTLVKAEIIDRFLQEFISNFEAKLPQPNTITLENQIAAFDKYSEALDKALEAYLSDSFYTSDLGGEAATHVTAVKAVLKAYFLRQWLAENGVMTELSALTTIGADGKPAVDIFGQQENHLMALGKSLTKLLKDLKPSIDKNDKTLSDAGVGTGSSSFGGGGEPSSGSDTGGGSDFDFTGGADMGGDGLGSEPDQTTATSTSETPGATEPGGETTATPAETDEEEEGEDDKTKPKGEKKPDGEEPLTS